MPLHAEAEAVAAVLDALDHAVGRGRVHHRVRAGFAHRLVVRGVHRHRRGAGDAGEQRARRDRDLVPRLVARVRLLVLERRGDRVGDVLDQVPPSATARSCSPPQMPSTGMSRAERAPRQRQLGFGAAFLERDGRVPVGVAVEGGIDVEGAAGDDQRVDAVQLVAAPAPPGAAERPAARRRRQPPRRSWPAARTTEYFE